LPLPLLWLAEDDKKGPVRWFAQRGLEGRAETRNGPRFGWIRLRGPKGDGVKRLDPPTGVMGGKGAQNLASDPHHSLATENRAKRICLAKKARTPEGAFRDRVWAEDQTSFGRGNNHRLCGSPRKRNGPAICGYTPLGSGKKPPCSALGPPFAMPTGRRRSCSDNWYQGQGENACVGKDSKNWPQMGEAVDPQKLGTGFSAPGRGRGGNKRFSLAGGSAPLPARGHAFGSSGLCRSGGPGGTVRDMLLWVLLVNLEGDLGRGGGPAEKKTALDGLRGFLAKNCAGAFALCGLYAVAKQFYVRKK